MTSYINSVQQVSITIPNGSTSATQTITAAVGTAFIIWQGETCTQAGTNPAITQSRVTLTNPTTVTATRNTSDTGTVTVNCVVVDATASLVKSVQFGTITTSTGTGTFAISAITTANTAIQYLGYSTTVTSSSPITEWAALSLTSTTQVTATVGSSGGTITVSFCVIEFQGAALNSSVQAVADAAAPSGATRTKTITSVTANNTMLIFAGQNTSGGAGYGTGWQQATLTNATTITIGTNSGGFLNIQYNCYVVEFIAGVLSQAAQRGVISIAAGTSGTAALTSAATANTVVNFLGNQTNGTNFNTLLSKDVQTSTILVTATTNTSATSKISWEALTFTAGASETVTIDKWFQRQDNPIIRAVPVKEGQQILPQMTSWNETINPDKWKPNYPDRIDVRKPLVPTGVYVELTGIITGENINLDKWEPYYPDRVDVRKPLNPSGYYVKSQFTTFTETIRIDKWKPVYPDKVYTYKPLVPEGYFTWPLGIALKENITLDKWEPYFPDRIDKKPRPIDTGLWAAIIGLETITLDKWKPTYSDIVWKFKPLVPEGWNIEPTGVTSPEDIKPDKWHPIYPDKVYGRTPLVPEGKIVHPVGIITGENIILTDWEPYYPDKIDTKKPLVPTGYFATPIGTVFPPMWYPTYQDIIWKAKRPVDTGVQVLPQLLSWAEKVSLDKWLGTYPDRVDKAKSALTSPIVVEPFVLEVITLDKWFNWQDNTPKRVGLFLNLTTGLFEPVFVPAVVPSTSTQIFWAITDDAFGLVFS